jgi:hypothetical protein
MGPSGILGLLGAVFASTKSVKAAKRLIVKKINAKVFLSIDKYTSYKKIMKSFPIRLSVTDPA